MTTPEYLIVGTACLALLAVIAAANILTSTRWWLCQNCVRWFNEHGEIQSRPPLTGIIDAHPRTCPKCCRRYNDSIP